MANRHGIRSECALGNQVFIKPCEVTLQITHPVSTSDTLLTQVISFLRKSFQ